jgi:DNA uptake protein ComE-like DNA-binding protein
MKVLTFLSALGFGLFAGMWLVQIQRRREERRPLVNINEASQQDMMNVLGLEAELAEQIIEHRPYPSKVDLLGRMVVPEQVYVAIKDKITYKAA